MANKMANKIPTAEEFKQKLDKANHAYTDEYLMIEFAKLHVKACKADIAEDYTYYLKGDEGSEILDKKKFNKEAYPLTNIK